MKKLLVMMFVLAIGIVMVQASEDVAQYLAKGDSAFDVLDNETALQNYLQVYKADSMNCEALWKISRAYVDIGENAEEQKQKDDYAKSEHFARLAVKRCPNNADAHLFLSVALGRVALISGKKQQVQMSKEVKEEAMKSLELAPDKDIAHHVLARWHRKVANLSGIQKTFAKILYGGLPDASNEKAVEHFQIAIKLNPTYINHHLELGLTYEETKEWQLAKEEYEKCLALPITASDDPDHKKMATERLAVVEKKLN